jgi:hypothetical protein
VRVNPFVDDFSSLTPKQRQQRWVFPGFSSLDRPNFAMKLPLSATARKRIDDAGSRVDKFSRENRSFLPEKAYISEIFIGLYAAIKCAKIQTERRTF